MAGGLITGAHDSAERALQVSVASISEQPISGQHATVVVENVIVTRTPNPVGAMPPSKQQ
jgi:hypothetical protein